MHCLSLFAVLALVLGSTPTMAGGDEAQCNSIGCVRPTIALDALAKTAERTLSMTRLAEPGTALGLCGKGYCATEPLPMLAPEHCGSAGCTTPDPKSPPAAAIPNDGASIRVSTLVADSFATVAERPMGLPPTIAWAEWTLRWGYGGLYKPSNRN
jgi:hypothetical protein